MDAMEHMQARWAVEYVAGHDRWYIVTEGWPSWDVAVSCRHFHGDPTGERTARAIVDAHNAALDAAANGVHG
jgi:hypothetical protein